MIQSKKFRTKRTLLTLGIVAFLSFGTRGTCTANAVSLARGKS